jgi:hypothetical protein
MQTMNLSKNLISKRHYYNILYDRFYQSKENQTPESPFEAKVRNDYQQWKNQANSKAVNLSKERFEEFKEILFESIGKAYNASVNITAIIFGISFVCIIFGGIFVNWFDYRNGNKESIYGVIICSILSILIILVTISNSKNKDY